MNGRTIRSIGAALIAALAVAGITFEAVGGDSRPGIEPSAQSAATPAITSLIPGQLYVCPIVTACAPLPTPTQSPTDFVPTFDVTATRTPRATPTLVTPALPTVCSGVGCPRSVSIRFRVTRFVVIRSVAQAGCPDVPAPDDFTECSTYRGSRALGDTFTAQCMVDKSTSETWVSEQPCGTSSATWTALKTSNGLVFLQVIN